MQRELSAKLTEGLSHLSIDMLTDSSKVSADFIIRNSNDCQPVCFRKSGAFCVLLQFIRFIVLRTIRLDDDFCFCAVKVGNLSSRYFLSGKTDGIGAQKVIPQMLTPYKDIKHN